MRRTNNTVSKERKKRGSLRFWYWRDRCNFSSFFHGSSSIYRQCLRFSLRFNPNFDLTTAQLIFYFLPFQWFTQWPIWLCGRTNAEGCLCSDQRRCFGSSSRNVDTVSCPWSLTFSYLSSLYSSSGPNPPFSSIGC